MPDRYTFIGSASEMVQSAIAETTAALAREAKRRFADGRLFETISFAIFRARKPGQSA